MRVTCDHHSTGDMLVGSAGGRESRMYHKKIALIVYSHILSSLSSSFHKKTRRKYPAHVLDTSDHDDACDGAITTDWLLDLTQLLDDDDDEDDDNQGFILDSVVCIWSSMCK